MSATIALPSSVAARSATRRPFRLWPEWSALLLYASTLAFAIPFHEPWADEAQAWQLARALSLHDLFFHALRYEGTPGLWHLLLHGLVRLHVSYVAMHWLVALIAVCGVSLLIFFAPFPRWVRLTLPFTFFFAFQYAVVARSYLLVPLLAFAAAAFWNKNPIILAALLGLLANTSLHGLALAVALGVVYVVETHRGLHLRHHARIALIVFLALLAIAVFTALPPPHDLSFDVDGLTESLGERLAFAPFMAFVYLLRAYAQPWQITVPCVIAILWLTYRFRGWLYLLPVLSVAALSGLGYWAYWHLGFAIIAIVVTAWITWRPLEPKWNLVVSSIVVLWLVIQLSYSVFAFAWDHDRAYSPDQAAAQFLAPYVDKGLPIALTVANKSEVGAFHSVGLAPYFDHPVFINQPRPYWLWTTHEHTDEQFKAALDQDPAAIVAMYYTHNHRRFDPARDLDIRRLHPLYERGYGVTHIFCGEKPEALGFREEICEIVLER